MGKQELSDVIWNIFRSIELQIDENNYDDEAWGHYQNAERIATNADAWGATTRLLVSMRKTQRLFREAITKLT